MDYKKLLDITLELEGLLMVRLHRDDAPAETDDLISAKIAALESSSTDADDAAIAASVELEETDDAEPETLPEKPEMPERSDKSDKSDKSDNSDSAPAQPAPPVSINDLATAFTLNDKFRFRRELFRNSDTELTETLDVLQAMDSIEEAEDYLYNDLAWDSENPEVKAFIALIVPFYSR